MANCYRIFTPPSSRAQRGNPLQSHDPSFLASVAWRSITQVLWTTPQGLDCHVGMKPPRSDGKKSSVIRSARWQTTTEPPLLRHRARSAAIHYKTLLSRSNSSGTVRQQTRNQCFNVNGFEKLSLLEPVIKLAK